VKSQVPSNRVVNESYLNQVVFVLRQQSFVHVVDSAASFKLVLIKHIMNRDVANFGLGVVSGLPCCSFLNFFVYEHHFMLAKFDYKVIGVKNLYLVFL
jgi:hypothetical protein